MGKINKIDPYLLSPAIFIPLFTLQPYVSVELPQPQPISRSSSVIKLLWVTFLFVCLLRWRGIVRHARNEKLKNERGNVRMFSARFSTAAASHLIQSMLSPPSSLKRQRTRERRCSISLFINHHHQRATVMRASKCLQNFDWIRASPTLKFEFKSNSLFPTSKHVRAFDVIDLFSINFLED